MYIYQVTHLPTKNFYIGFENLPITENGKNLDPMNVFGDSGTGHNGRAPMSNLSKEVVLRVGSKEEAESAMAEIAKKYEDNPFFKGIKMVVKTKPIAVVNKKIVEDTKE